MDVKTGFKQTDVGLIPEDWSALPLGHILKSTQLGGNYKNSEYETNWPLVKMGNLGRGKISLTRMEFVDSSQAPSSRDRLYKNDILFNTRNTLDLVGKVAVWRDELPEAYFNSNIMRMEFDSGFVSSKILMNYVLNMQQSISGLRAIATGTTSVAAIYGRDLAKFAVALPSMSEQGRIAEVLSDADALIESLERLLTKKRKIKQGAMQELLTGQRRLPGFGGEWGMKRLGDIAHIKTGNRNNQDKVDDGEYPFFVRSAIVERINSYSHDCEAILIPGEGGIGSIFHYISGRFDVHQRVYAITQFADSVLGRYVHLYMSTHFGTHAMQNSVKATVDSLRLPTFQAFEVALPPTIEEQAAIAEVLSDMDTEHATLETKLSKAHQLKQGMMQVLLTGQIRLPLGQPA